MPNLKLQRKKNLSTFRRIALGSWKTVGDPSVYGSLTLEMDEALRYLDTYREVTGRRLTLSHMMGKAMAATLEAMPDANAIIRFGRLYMREDISVFFQVALEDPLSGEIDLSGTIVHHADKKPLLQFIDEFEKSVKKVRTGNDENLEKSRSLFKRIPLFTVRWLLNFIGFMGFSLNMDMRWAGVPQDPFGSVLITNIGSLGLEEAYVPLVPYSRVPLLVAIGAVKDVPTVKDGELAVSKQMRVFATFDHRVLDGAHAAKMAKTLKAWFEHPFEHFGPIEKEEEHSRLD